MSITTRRYFAWIPVWIHQEYPPWGLGRFRWLRWVEIPSEDLQSRIDRQWREAVGWSAAAIVLSIVALVVMVSGCRAAELPCPPKRYFCWEVRAAVAAFGEQAVIAKALKCGWSEIRIEVAKRCLNGQR